LQPFSPLAGVAPAAKERSHSVVGADRFLGRGIIMAQITNPVRMGGF